MKYLANLGICLINVISIPIGVTLFVLFATADFVIKTITNLIPCKFTYILVTSWNRFVYHILLNIVCVANVWYDIESDEEENEEN